MIYNSTNFYPILDKLANSEIIKNNKKIEYFNIANSFDIETTSFYDGEEKRAIMYEWTLDLSDDIIIGRTWDEFLTVYNAVINALQLSLTRRLVIYAHNLAFEYQFLRRRFAWDNVFAISERKPIYAVTLDGVEFRCSYLLSGYGLAKLGEQLQKYKVNKLVGDLDYSLIRHAQTPLTDKELQYCINDVKVVTSYIKELIERDGDITKIPLTKTGYVRNFCRNSCLYDKSSHKKSFKWLEYRRIMQRLTLTSDEYKQLKRAFQGGFTHANAFYSGKTMYNVRSYDFTSSYPSVMVAERYPMSRGETITISTMKEFQRNLKCYCCLFDIEFTNIESINLNENYISASRCVGNKIVTDNGRVASATRLVTTLTEQDYFIIEKFYKWDKIKISNFRRYRRGYLPTNFVKAILKLYSGKTTLKDVEEKQAEYINSKEMLNACYGMTVTDICRDNIKCDGETWTTEPVDVETEIEKYNRSKKRFLFYAWGVWVTAYARRNLFTAIYEFGNDYIYSDTDSVKVLNADKHLKYINGYNANVTAKLERALSYHNLPVELIRPKTIKGIEKPLGVWDDEGVYSKFKTLGAKRYMTEKNEKTSLTVSGINKKTAIPYLLEKYGKNKIFDKFADDLYIPKYNDLKTPIFTDEGLPIDTPTGKNTHTYIDYEITGFLTDYKGVTLEYDELSSVHLEPADYNLSLSIQYLDYLTGIQEYEK